VFHFEFEFIHPFIDGNGRMGRLWQSLILGKLHPLFEHLPVENMVYSNQQAYYDAITASTNAGQSGPFIDFMLNEIYNTLKTHQGEPLPDKLQDKVPKKVPNKVPNKLRTMYPDLSDSIWSVFMEIKANPHATSEEIGSSLSISSRMVRKYIAILRERDIIERIGGNKTGYWKIIKK
jgi:Fic family protein